MSDDVRRGYLGETYDYHDEPCSTFEDSPHGDRALMSWDSYERLRAELDDWRKAADLHFDTPTTPRDLRLEFGRLHEDIDEKDLRVGELETNEMIDAEIIAEKNRRIEGLEKLVKSAYHEAYKRGYVAGGQHPDSDWWMSRARRVLDGEVVSDE